MSLIPEGQSLFVIDITYAVPFEQIEPVLAPHMDFVKKGYAEGHFLTSGPKNPRSGGVVIAMGTSKADIEALMAQDPFAQEGVVTMEITEFSASNRVPGL
ncbi:YciI family protein [Salipiger abyssi]|uniref:YciI family protein n=1 Tax=Salipiger abyssi TaxID=1250539 RepID=UPI001A901A8F|nr:YciI family protein [Salipiger abyssi]MBN9886046.1 hypothetical protein [Salipiger abyssi]